MQSSLDPAGVDAAVMKELFVVMTAAGAIIWVAVAGLALYATRIRTGEHRPGVAHGLIIGGGVIGPLFLLSALLIYGLSPLADILALPPAGGPVITVTGEQWWWRVRYDLADGRVFELANELHLPVGHRVELQLESADVIHSFWLPSIAGKMDMVPGRVNRIALEPTRAGVYRGACAEYCGTSHARMNFYAVVEDGAAFDAWATRQNAAAEPPTDPTAVSGQAALLANGCGGCHTVRGTRATGRIGPDLTHVGARLSIGAGMLPMQIGELQRWIEVTERVKPGVHMPSFNMLAPDEVRAIAVYLAGLQ